MLPHKGYCAHKLAHAFQSEIFDATTALGFSKGALKKSVYNVLVDDDTAAANILT